MFEDVTESHINPPTHHSSAMQSITNQCSRVPPCAAQKERKSGCMDGGAECTISLCFTEDQFVGWCLGSLNQQKSFLQST